MPVARILAHGLEFRYDSHLALAGISLRIERGDMVALIGPNGAGKSTLLKCLTRALRPRCGAVLVEGRDIGRLGARELARRIGMVPQAQTLDFDFTVEEIVAMGRHPYLPPFGGLRPADLEAVRQALEATGTGSLAERPVSSLSGGEQQRVTLARALAQEPEILLLDEPTAHLDIAYQVEIMEMVRDLNRRRGMTVLAAVHDLNLAARYFPRFLLLAGGKILAAGRAEQVLRPEILRRAYGVEVIVTKHPVLACPIVFPAPRPVPAGDARVGGGRG